MRFWGRRRRTGSQVGTPATTMERAPRNEWRDLPPIQRTAAPPPTTIDPAFTDRLTTSGHPLFLADLEHLVEPDGPSGIVGPRPDPAPSDVGDRRIDYPEPRTSVGGTVSDAAPASTPVQRRPDRVPPSPASTAIPGEGTASLVQREPARVARPGESGPPPVDGGTIPPFGVPSPSSPDRGSDQTLDVPDAPDDASPSAGGEPAPDRHVPTPTTVHGDRATHETATGVQRAVVDSRDGSPPPTAPPPSPTIAGLSSSAPVISRSAGLGARRSRIGLPVDAAEVQRQRGTGHAPVDDAGRRAGDEPPTTIPFPSEGPSAATTPAAAAPSVPPAPPIDRQVDDPTGSAAVEDARDLTRIAPVLGDSPAPSVLGSAPPGPSVPGIRPSTTDPAPVAVLRGGQVAQRVADPTSRSDATVTPIDRPRRVVAREPVEATSSPWPVDVRTASSGSDVSPPASDPSGLVRPIVGQDGWTPALTSQSRTVQRAEATRRDGPATAASPDAPTSRFVSDPGGSGDVGDAATPPILPPSIISAVGFASEITPRGRAALAAGSPGHGLGTVQRSAPVGGALHVDDLGPPVGRPPADVGGMEFSVQRAPDLEPDDADTEAEPAETSAFADVAEVDVIGLMRTMYPHLRRRLTRDLLLDRERLGYRTDIRY